MIESTSFRKALNWALARKFDPDQPRDANGKWSREISRAMSKAHEELVKSHGQAEYHRKEKERFTGLAEQSRQQAQAKDDENEKRLHESVANNHSRIAEFHGAKEQSARDTHAKATQRIAELQKKHTVTVI